MGKSGGGCEDDNCSLATGFLQKCSNQVCYGDEQMFGLIELVCVTIICIPLMLFGLLGNILTILVVWLRPYMRSSTYLYLSSLAVSDILILLLLPVDLKKLWRPRPWTFGDLSCKLTMYFAECCTFCSILHITFISLERYVAVCWPFTAKTLVTRRRTRTIIGCIWLGAAISAAPVLVMVGVEDVGSEDQGLSGWRESSAWVGKEGEQGFIIGERERENEDEVLKEVTFEEIGKDKEINECSDKIGETKGFTGGDKTLEFKEWNEKEQDQGERAAKAEGAIRGEGKRTQNEMKEDEGGGGRDVDRGDRAQVDLRECRFTEYAVSSGLLSTMLILSNMYFLVPLCILGPVYSLIGRTLWLRSQNSRRDVNNRHIVKMLGVIVLVFVLCWLPFHVGRTIFAFTLVTDRHPGNASRALADLGLDGYVNIDAYFQLEHPPKTGNAVIHAQRESDQPTRDVFAEGQGISAGTGGDTGLATPGPETNSDPDEQSDEISVTPENVYATENDTLFHSTRADSQYFLYYLSQYINLASSVLFYLSAAINPLLYNLMSERYRHAVHSLMRKHARTQTYGLQTHVVPHSATTVH